MCSPMHTQSSSSDMLNFPHSCREWTRPLCVLLPVQCPLQTSPLSHGYTKSMPPISHFATIHWTDRHTDTDQQMGSVTSPVPIPAYILSIIVMWLIVCFEDGILFIMYTCNLITAQYMSMDSRSLGQRQHCYTSMMTIIKLIKGTAFCSIIIKWYKIAVIRLVQQTTLALSWQSDSKLKPMTQANTDGNQDGLTANRIWYKYFK